MHKLDYSRVSYITSDSKVREDIYAEREREWARKVLNVRNQQNNEIFVNGGGR